MVHGKDSDGLLSWGGRQWRCTGGLIRGKAPPLPCGRRQGHNVRFRPNFRPRGRGPVIDLGGGGLPKSLISLRESVVSSCRLLIKLVINLSICSVTIALLDRKRSGRHRVEALGGGR